MPSISILRTPGWAGGSLNYPDAIRTETVRVTTGSVAGASQAEVSVTFDKAFSDTNYTLMCQVEESTAATDTLKVLKIVSKSTTGCVVRVQNVNASARTGTLHVLAIGD
jgi:hypothetical protein